MKKIVMLIVSLFLVVFLAACGGESTDNSNEEQSGNNNEQVESSDQVETTEQNEQPEQDKPEDDANVEESEFGKRTIVKQNKDVNQTVESGPMVLTINAIQSMTVEPNEIYKDFFDGKDEVTVITVNMKVENTSDDTISFYPDQAVLTTDAGDQVDADLFLSDDVGGDFFGKVNKEGNVIFQVNTPAEEINTIKLIIHGAHDEDFNSLSEDLHIELSF